MAERHKEKEEEQREGDPKGEPVEHFDERTPEERARSGD